MADPPDLARLEDWFPADATSLHYLGGESRQQLLRQSDVLLDGGSYLLPAHRCILSKGSKVLAALFESVPSAPSGTTQPERMAKRLRADDGVGSSSSAPPAGTLGACTRLRTPFSDYSQPAVLLLLHLQYNTHRAARVARFAVGQPTLVSELIQLCDALDAPRALRMLDAGLEAALQRPDEPQEHSDDEESDPLAAPHWDADSEPFLVDTLLAAERWRAHCPRWFGAAAARLGARVMDMWSVDETRIPMQRLLDMAAARQLSPDTLLQVMSCSVACMRQTLVQQQGLANLKRPAPAFDFMRNRQMSMQDVLHFLYQPEGVTAASTTLGKGPQSWQINVCIQRNSPILVLAVKRARGFENFDKVSGYRKLTIRARVLSSAGQDAMTEHALDFGHDELRGRESKRSHTPLATVADLGDPEKGLVNERGEITVELQVQVTCLDM